MMKLWQIISAQSSQNMLYSQSNEPNDFTTTAKSDYAKILAEKIANARNDMEQMSAVQEQLDEIAELHEELTGRQLDEESNSNSSSSEAVETIKKFMPDGSVLIMTVKGGEVVEQFKKKPHLVAVADPSAPPTPSGNVAVTMKVKPQLDLFNLI